MKRIEFRALVIIGLFQVICAGGVAGSATNETQVAERWLEAWDQNNFEAAAALVHPNSEMELTREGFEENWSQFRGRLGALIERNLFQRSVIPALPGENERVAFVFKSRFVQDEGVEEVILMQTDDGQYRVVEYSVAL